MDVLGQYFFRQYRTCPSIRDVQLIGRYEIQVVSDFRLLEIGVYLDFQLHEF
jgi:hypothetical protein